MTKKSTQTTEKENKKVVKDEIVNKEEEFVITIDMIKNANSYTSIEDKVAYARQSAYDCLEEAMITKEVKEANTLLALPPEYVENQVKKALYSLKFFLTYYFGISVGIMDVRTFNKYGRCHIMGQMEKLKRNKEIKDKVFDILDDFEEFKKYLNVEIYNYKSIMNNSITRLLASMKNSVTPENMETITEKIKEVNDTLNKETKKTKKIDTSKTDKEKKEEKKEELVN